MSRPHEKSRAGSGSGSGTPLAEEVLGVAQIGAFRWNAQTGETEWQGRWSSVLGFEETSEPPTLEAVLDRTDPADAEAARSALDTLRASLVLDTTVRVHCPDRALRWLRFRSEPTSEDVVGVIEDVTQQTNERERLRKRDDEYHVITDYALDMIMRTDIDRQIRYISKSSERVLGLSPSQMLGQAARGGIHREDREAVDRSYDEIIRESGSSTATFRVRHRDGHWVWIESLGRAIHDRSSGAVKEVLYVMRDVSRRVEAEEQERRARDELLRVRRDQDEIRRSEELFRELADSTPVLMWLMDREGRPTWVNRAVFDYVGHSDGNEIHGTSLIHPDDVANVFEKALPALKRGAAFTLEARIQRHDGEYRSTLFTSLPRQTAGDEFSGYVASGVDVTEIRKAEAANAEHRSRLAHSLRVESLDQMALGLAHELHQPLAAISAATGAALRLVGAATPDLERLREMMTEAQAQAIRGGALLEEMREFIRKGGALEQAADAPIDLNEIVESVASLARHEANRRETQLDLRLSPSPLRVDGSRVQIQQVLINVVQNGLQAMSPGNGGERVLRIESEVDGRGSAEIRVLDNGPGISEASAHHMFDVFYTTRKDGLGMGLAISQSIVEAHGGRLTGKNRPRGGACFTIKLPMADGADRDVGDQPRSTV